MIAAYQLMSDQINILLESSGTTECVTDLD